MAGSTHLTRRTAVRGAALMAGGALLGGAAVIGASGSARAAAAPRVYTRDEWNARPPLSPAEVLNHGPIYVVVHHTATENSTDYSLRHAKALSRAIQDLHMDTNGWSDTGQQLTISRGGHVMEGRNRSLAAIRDGHHVVGAHVANHNNTTVGIENEGLYTSVSPTDALYASLVSTCAWLCSTYALDPQAAIVGHRDFNATQCPGDTLYGMLPQLRDDVAGRLARMGVTPPRRDRGDVPLRQRPTYPDVPKDARPEHWHDHGPAVGPRDPASAAG